jgi:hypothetical protein
MNVFSLASAQQPDGEVREYTGYNTCLHHLHQCMIYANGSKGVCMCSHLFKQRVKSVIKSIELSVDVANIRARHRLHRAPAHPHSHRQLNVLRTVVQQLWVVPGVIYE